MNTPRRPPEPPSHGAPPDQNADHNPPGDTPHGIPEGIDEHEPKGRPTSDREQTESALNRIQEDK